MTGDADLVALNIASGVNIFGVVGSFVSDCGNGVIDAGEDCDFGDLGGETCATQGEFGDGLVCSGCVFDASGCSLTRYEDTSLGSVIDHQTGLEWQKTDDAGGLTDKDNVYTWTAGSTEANGTAFGVFLEGLNGGTASSGAGPTAAGYAGHNDWRMPRIEELTTILLEPSPCGTAPCIEQSVFGVTGSWFYWSSTTFATSPGQAWFVDFNTGFVSGVGKSFDLQVRAVRGGS